MNKLGYIKEIDGLRAIAVISVLIYHLNSSFLPGGFTGVDIFFVISGFVVSKSICERDISRIGFLKSIVEFYSRRFLRIYPALIAMLLITAILSVAFIPASWLSNTSEKTAFYAFFGFGNVALYLFNDGYFSPRSEFNPFTHTWSLGVEEQFYLFFGPVFIFLLIIKRNTLLIAFFLVLLIMSFIYSGYLNSTNQDQKSFYLIFSRFWELAAGVLTFILTRTNITQSISKSSVSCIIGFVFIFIGLLFADSKTTPYPSSILSIIGTVLLLINISSIKNNTNKISAKILNNKISVFFGKISYSLYLWHWPVFCLMRWTSGLETILQYTFAVISSLVLATISYVALEKKVILKAKNKNSYLTLIIGVLIITASAFATEIIFKTRENYSFSQTKNYSLWYPYGNHSPKKDSRLVDFSGKKIFIVGDSHAGAYTRLATNLKSNTGADYKIYASSCSMVNLIAKFNESEQCKGLISKIISEIKINGNPGDIVMFSSLRMIRLSNQWAVFDEKKSIEDSINDLAINRIKEARNQSLAIIKHLQDQGFIVLIDHPKPIFHTPPFRCSDWFNKDNPICINGFEIDRNILVLMKTPVVNSINSIEGIQTWDPFAVLCPENKSRCSSFDDEGKPLFFDGDHLSGHGNDFIYKSFEKKISEIWSN